MNIDETFNEYINEKINEILMPKYRLNAIQN